MPEWVNIRLNGQRLQVPAGTVVAAALAQAGLTRFRCSVQGDARGPLCGMGVCFECRVTINGHPHCRSCLTLCEPGMEIQTDE
jgi:D-hydroxyproline dehydrogenase subunit gamma